MIPSPIVITYSIDLQCSICSHQRFRRHLATNGDGTESWWKHRTLMLLALLMYIFSWLGHETC
ncbi:hypothetical protein H5410_003342 [Solanum commersonii]|uniref:Uncharacterized protein n=1 Tax=Solanum commersonii TaxID=4109 RepID=A0A9J6B4K2_SOLCO|nr:hypothetical protein H5410_003342 [Solanum commersonii]